MTTIEYVLKVSNFIGRWTEASVCHGMNHLTSVAVCSALTGAVRLALIAESGATSDDGSVCGNFIKELESVESKNDAHNLLIYFLNPTFRNDEAFRTIMCRVLKDF